MHMRRVSATLFVVLFIGHSKSNQLVAQGTFKFGMYGSLGEFALLMHTRRVPTKRFVVVMIENSK